MAFALSTMQLESPAFQAHGAIPAQHTGEGADTSPALSWRDAPEGTKGYAIICHDPDARLVHHGSYGFVHWLLFNLPGSTTDLAEAAGEGTSGKNDLGKLGYGVPCRPGGQGWHHSYFWV